mmetsp:Transcript_179526/g.436800  ORF Transcript_179526/g.436800 Transcript_179526/m.436800 type:complete len:215 (-) Transcript_179526:113-757(-)
MAWPTARQAFSAPASAVLKARVSATGTPFTFRIWSPSAQPKSSARGSVTVATTRCFTVRPSFAPSRGCGTMTRKWPAACSRPTNSLGPGAAAHCGGGAVDGSAVDAVAGRVIVGGGDRTFACVIRSSPTSVADARAGAAALLRLRGEADLAAEEALTLAGEKALPAGEEALPAGEAVLGGTTFPLPPACGDDGLSSQFRRTASSGFHSRRWPRL